jgi:hypothetical protein
VTVLVGQGRPCVKTKEKIDSCGARDRDLWPMQGSFGTRQAAQVGGRLAVLWSSSSAAAAVAEPAGLVASAQILPRPLFSPSRMRGEAGVGRLCSGSAAGSLTSAVHMRVGSHYRA